MSAIAELLLHSKEDLIHKTVGWTLCEVGKRSRDAEESLLAKPFRDVPRSILRYATGKLPEIGRLLHRHVPNICPSFNSLRQSRLTVNITSRSLQCLTAISHVLRLQV